MNLMPAVTPFPAPHRGLKPREREPRPVEWLLNWAFRDQRVDIGGAMPWLSPSRSQTANICDILQLQAIVQGRSGGTAEPIDAIVIAAHVQRLRWHPRMLVVAYARAGRRPDPMAGAEPRVEPAEWHTNRHGTRAKAKPLGKYQAEDRDGRLVWRDALGCLIRYAPSPEEIAHARRRYAEWWQAVRDVSLTLRVEQPLEKWWVSSRLPEKGKK